MNRNGIAMLAAAGTLIVLACVIPPRAEAQNLARRLSGVRDGKVRMSFASRDDICGFENGVSTNARENRNSRGNWNSSGRSEDVAYDNECSEGPVRVVATYEAGRLTKIKTYVGGRWRPAGSDVTDAGTVSTRDAVDYLLGIARTQAGKPAGEAIYPVTLADSVDIAQPIYSIAKDEGRPNEVRDQAIFWLGQGRAGGGDYLRSLYTRVHSDELKDKIIFSMSQQKDAASQKWLVNLVSNQSESIENRKKALFWAGQTGTSIEQLTSLYGRMDEREMKDQMIFVFSQRHERVAIDKLMDIAKNDKDRDARKKAMFWLGQSHDARVSAFLSDMINR